MIDPSAIPTSASAESPPTAKRPGSTRRRGRRKRGWLLVIAALAAIYWALTSSPAIRWIVAGRLEAMTGARLTEGKVRVRLNGHVAITGAVMRVPGIGGSAGEFLRVERLDVALDWVRLLGLGSRVPGGDSAVRYVSLHHPTLRLAADSSIGRWNIDRLELASVRTAASAPPHSASIPSIPTIRIDGGNIEIGEHSHGESTPVFTLLRRLHVRGEFVADPDRGPGNFEMIFTHEDPSLERPISPPQNVESQPIRLTGTITPDEIAVSTDGLSFRDWPASTFPAMLRRTAELLDLEGRIGRSTVTYAPRAPSPTDDAPGSIARWRGIRASVQLIDVAMNVPVTYDAEVVDSTDYPLLRMRGVSGTLDLSDQGLRADLSGSAEDLPYRVEFQTRGVSPDSPFDCVIRLDDVQLRKEMDIYIFMPLMAQSRLSDFSWPTGTVDATVHLARGDPVDGVASEVSARGEIELRDGTAAFRRFPYEFQGILGRASFDDTRIEITELVGESPAGARIRATALIAPPDKDAQVTVDINVDRMPVDDDVIRALAARRKGVVPILFNREHHERMLAAGLVSRPGSRAGDPDAPPEFGLDGMATVRTIVTRPLGPGFEWFEDTRIEFDSLHLLPEWFPMPLIANGVTVHISDDVMNVFGGSYRTIEGGSVVANAGVDYELVIDPRKKGLPDLRIDAIDVPVGRLFNYAVAGAMDRVARNSGSPSKGPRLRAILDEMDIDATADATVELWNEPDGEPRVRASVDVAEATMNPTPSYVGDDHAETRLGIDRVRARVDLLDSDLRFSINGSIDAATSAGGSSQFASPAAGSIFVDGAVTNDPLGDSALRVVARGERVPIDAPLDRVIGVFSPSTAGKFREFADTYRPAGLVGGTVTVEPGPDDLRVTVAVDSFSGLGFEIEGHRAEFDHPTGSVSIRPDGAIVFDEFSAGLTADSLPCAQRLRINGSTVPDPQTDDWQAQPGTRFSIDRARAESPLIRRLLADSADPEDAQTIESLDPHGEFSIEVDHVASPGADSKVQTVGVARPHSLAVTLDGTRISFDEISGRINFDERAGQFREIRAGNANCSIRLDGGWNQSPDDDLTLDLTLSGSSRGLSREIRAMLPDSVASVVKSIDLDVSGELELPVMQLRLTRSEVPERQSLSASGQVRMVGGSMTLGLPVTECDGELEFRVRNTDFSTPPAFNITAEISKFRLAGLGMEHGRVTVEGMPDTGEIIVRDIDASCYGGRFAGSAIVGAPRPGPSGEAVPREFQTTFVLSGVRFAPTLRDLTAGAGRETAAETVSDTDATRGLIDGQISFGGRIGDVTTRRGRGSATIAGPSVMRMPLVMPLIRFSNLQLPSDEPLEFARASFYVDGSTLAFEDLSVYSQSVQLLGFGTIQWPQTELDLRFNSRAVQRIPVLNWLIEGIRDEFVTTRVRGTLAQPQVDSVPFDQTRRFFLDVFGSSITEQERRMLELEREARRGGETPR